MWLTCFCLQSSSSSSCSLGKRSNSVSWGFIISVVIIRRGFYHWGHVNSPQVSAVIYFLSESGIISGWPFFAHYLMLKVAESYISDVCNLLNTFLQVLWCASILTFQLKKAKIKQYPLPFNRQSLINVSLEKIFITLYVGFPLTSDFCYLPAASETTDDITAPKLSRQTPTSEKK